MRRFTALFATVTGSLALGAALVLGAASDTSPATAASQVGATMRATLNDTPWGLMRQTLNDTPWGLMRASFNDTPWG